MIKRIIGKVIRKTQYIIATEKKRQVIDAIQSACKAQHNYNRKEVLKRLNFITYDPNLSYTEAYVRQMNDAFDLIQIQKGYFVYPYDSNVFRIIPKQNRLICSLTADYSKILESNLIELKQHFLTCNNVDFSNTQIELIDAIIKFANKISQSLENKGRDGILKQHMAHMIYREPQSFDEALQKILFYNALFWQANHWHIGLGRLDVILDKYYCKDLMAGIITRESARQMLIEFIATLNRDVRTKSKTILGDTGQYILLGGKTKKYNAFENDITELFLEIFSEYTKPDPKLILRVNNYTSKNIWDRAISCVTAGNGSPLIMNEEPIMDNMIQFGYSKDDIYELGTSACWEPLIIGKSFDQNNTFAPIMAYKPLNELIKSCKNYKSFDELLSDYKLGLANHIKDIITDFNYDVSPLFTLFFDDCLQKELDFTKKGARYSYHGAQVLSFPNTINALLNIKEKVFEKKLITLTQCKNVITSNYVGHEDILKLFKTGNLKYGSTNPIVVKLTNCLMDIIGHEVAKHKMNGERVKVGFSSPNYIMSCNNTEATLDGRKANEPFAVHISPISSDIDLPEILKFASMLNYEDNRINGNIVDFTISNSYLQNKKKLRDIIISACKDGLFEVQLNVLSYEKLLDAKAHPDKYPNLVVRVWGFSAYFNDLPEMYKDNLIERAKLYDS